MINRKHILAGVIVLLHLFPPSQLFSQSPVYFYNVGDQTGTKFYRNCHGSGFFDYNSDGYDDIFIVHNVSVSPQGPKPHVLLKNLGDGTFVDVAGEAGVEGYNTSAQGLAAGDYNNDGYTDIAIGMGHWYTALYKNNGDGTFSDVSSSAKVTVPNRGRTLAFVDYDNDGYLDLFVFGDNDGSPDIYSLSVYKNKGDGTFAITSKQAGLGYERSSDDIYGFAFADVDNDGDMDFFVPNYTNSSKFFLNNGNGTFTESTTSGLPRTNKLMGAIFLDYNNDGWFDLFVRRAWKTFLLFRNNHDGTFTDVTNSAGVGVILDDKIPFGGGLSTGDFDNDGFIDILAIHRSGRNFKLFHNNGDGTFTEIASSANLTENSDWNWSAPIADYDHDGYLDIYLARNGDTKSDGTTDYYATLFRNAGGTNNWLHVKLEGVQSNRSAIGARLVAYVNGKLQMRQILGGGGYKTDSFPAEFGLAHATEVDSLIIYWPSGIIQKVFKIMANQRITVVEQGGSFYYGPFSLSGQIRYYNNNVRVPKVQLNMSGDEVRNSTVNDSGAYAFSDIKGEEAITVTPVKSGGEDIGSGTLSAYDAALTARYAVGLQELTEDQKKAADVDESGTVYIVDAASIARAAVGLSGIAGSHVGEWRFVPASREYPRMSDNYENADFTAIVLGDVSGNWSMPTGMSKAYSASVLPVDSMIVDPMDTVYIPLVLEKGIDLLSSDVWLRYDANVLKFLGATTTSFSHKFNLIYNDSKAGFLKIALYGTNPLQGTDIFLIIKFQVISNVDQKTTISWDRYQLNDCLYEKPDVRVDIVTSCEKGPTPLDFHLEDNFPNPFNSGTTISYQLAAPSRVSLVIYDIMGRRIRTLINNIQSQGKYQVKWDGKADNGKDVPSGIYVCRLTAGGRSWVLKMAKTK